MFILRFITLLALSVSFAFAQSNEKEVTVTFSTAANLVKTSFLSDKIDITWDNVSELETKTKQEDGKFLLTGKSGVSTLDLKKFSYYLNIPNIANPPHTVESSFDGTIETGKKWKSEQHFTGFPVTWCASTLESKMTSDFSVGEKEVVSILLAGTPTDITVYPIYERGIWARCISGKFLRKILFSKELGAPISVETVMYSYNGKDIVNSHFFKIKEIKK